MTKKILMGALLVSSLLISSCVKEQETQTVVDLRTAKAEQLSARAALNNAKAQAATIVANADAALMEAKAKAEEAAATKLEAETTIQVKQNELKALQIEYAKIQVEEQKILNEKKQLELSEAIRQLELTKAYAERDLANIAAEMEILQNTLSVNLAYAQAQLFAAQQRIIDYEIAKVEDATDAELYAAQQRMYLINQITNEYAYYVEELYACQQELAEYQLELSQLQTGILNLEEFKSTEIAKVEAKINPLQAEIEIYRQYVNYNDDIDALRDNLNALQAKRGLLVENYNIKARDLNNVVLDPTERDVIYNELLADDFINFSRGYSFMNHSVYELDNWYNIYINNSYETGIWDYFFQNAYSTSFNWYVYETEYTTIEQGNHKVSINSGRKLTLTTGSWIADQRIVEVRINELVNFFKQQIEMVSELMDVYVVNYDGKATGYFEYPGAEITPYPEDAEEMPNAVQRTLAAKAAYDKNPSSENESAYREAIRVEKWLEEQQTSLLAQLVHFADNQVFAEAYADFCVNYDSHIATLDEKFVAWSNEWHNYRAPYVQAATERYLAQWELNDLDTEINAINTLISNAESIEYNITNREQKIAELQAHIEEINALDEHSFDQAIELINIRIEKIEVELSVIQYEVDYLSAYLNALIEE